MGAVWGFTGPPDARVATSMGSVLSHRGGPRIDATVDSRSTIQLREPHGALCIGTVPPGIYEAPQQGLTLALCGWLTGIGDARLAHAAAEIPSASPVPFYRLLTERFRAEGPRVFDHLRGAYILVVRDGPAIHITRDGAGNRTVFYARRGDDWLFGIEPKAITAVAAFSKRIRPAALAQYLACSFVPGWGTMLEDLYELKAGHTVTLQSGQPARLCRWFRFEEDEPPYRQMADPTNGGNSDASVISAFPPSVSSSGDASCIALPVSTSDAADERLAARFRQEMERAVAQRIPRGEPVGVFLSGGLDSSIITAELARQIGGKNVRTWAIHFGPKYRHELEFARAVAERCGTVHEEVLIQPRNFLPRLRRMVWHLDDPIGDPITQPNFELAAHVSRDVRYIFNGEGGDPCFGGPKNIPMMLHHWYGGLDRQDNFRERHYLESYRRAWDEIHFLLSDEVRQQIDVGRDLDGVFAPYLRAEHPRLFLNRLTSINIREKGAHLIQPKVERMLAAHGLTPLAPLFDERLIRFSFRMPPRWKLHRGIEKTILKRAYENELPAEVIHRPKSGMRVPVQYWFRGEMRRYARKILSPKAVRRAGLFNPERVKQLLDYNIEEGRGRYGLRLWMLITFELWRRIVVEGESV
jgi:asparagine synthase (glutamine-hydrolysing)